MKPELKILVRLVSVLSSNVDDFGIFCQGVMTGLLTTLEKDEVKQAVAEPSTPETLIQESGAAMWLFERFRNAKTATETLWVNAPPAILAYRDKVVVELEAMAKKEKA